MKKLKLFSKLTSCLSLLIITLCFILSSCYTLYPAPSGTPGTGSTTTQTQQSGNTTPIVTPEGILVPGASLTDKLAWLQRSADSHNTYILEVRANENIAPHILEYSGAINITIILRGDGQNRTIRLRSNGAMFNIRSNVTLILDNNITLQGHSGNVNSVVYINHGILIMNEGSTITGNTNTRNFGGGVIVERGSFTMNAGTISNNFASYGGGVHVGETFVMNGGTISGNTASQGGGGVSMWLDGGTFIMNDGTISGNTAPRGGGVYLYAYGSFTMRGGLITGNTAYESGGGVATRTIFNKTGGIITGYASDPSNGNVVGAGNVLARSGHAVYIEATRRRETTAGEDVNLSSLSNEGWE